MIKEKNIGPIKIKLALISVYDKTGLVDFAKKLQQLSIEIISTNDTLEILREAGIKVKSVSEITGFPEMLDGSIKTLHPQIYAGLLAKDNNEFHQQQLKELNIDSIDLVVVNLPPFEAPVNKSDIGLEEVIERIDIDKFSLVRSAAKNFYYKTVVCNPLRYNTIIEELLKNNYSISYETRFALAKEGFIQTARYDTIVARYLSSVGDTRSGLPETFTLIVRKVDELRYGENPHQKAALYGDYFSYFEKLFGKELSFNNIVDIQTAAEMIAEFEKPSVVIVKQGKICGVGSDEKLADAYCKALATDARAASGGIVVLNRPLDMKTAKLVNEIFLEALIAPEYQKEVFEFLRKKKDRRLIRQIKPIVTPFNFKQITGGVLLQESDRFQIDPNKLKFVTKRSPEQKEIDAMLFGWRVVKHLKSNAIVIAQADRTIGIGSGQMSRIDSIRTAISRAKKAKLDLNDTVIASDAFFPYPDSIHIAHKAGIRAIIQPGGSIRDAEVIEAANKTNIAMVFTGIRHYKH